ncbi:MAG: PBP1A family penicillin-binding protein [Parcubacteria group bacterium]|nr:PBP1A family penicillin-binding protein [Parcubacteria group bacterium]
MPILKLRKRDSRHYGRISLEKVQPIQTPKRKKYKIKKRKWLKTIVIFLVIMSSLGFVGGTIAVVWATRDLPNPNKLIERKVSQSTKIYDRTGEHLLYEVYQNQKRTLVELDKIAEHARQATVAVEDKHFYTHKGVRIQSILRAGFNNLIGRKAGSGGASTLTQQLIKNAIVGNEHSYLRKIKEAIIAIRIEKKYNKDEILKLYLNEIPYGSTNYGIESASQSYFKKNAKDLTLAESATLAAIPKAPSYYLNDMYALANRRDTVLNLMEQQGFITKEEKNFAQNTPLKMQRGTGILEAPHFVLYVKQLLADSFGEKTVDEGGLKVITTLDYEKQKIAKEAIKEIGDINAEKYNANNAALVAIDPKTGEVLAMVGSRDFSDDKINGKYNVAVLGKRQPGSSFKPMVYTAAFEKGFTPETVLFDIKTNFEKNKDKKDYIPKNYTGEEYGLVTLRKALQGSLNIASVKTLYLVGAKSAIEFAKKFGYTTLTGDYGLSLVLGGGEVTLYEHTTAFAALANNGVYHKPFTILNVTDHNGKEIYKTKKSKGEKIIDKEIAATISDVLSDDNARAYIFDTNSILTLPGRVVAAKTGTTDDSKDAWTMGYTPSLATGVWVGNTIPATMKGGGSKLAAPIWNKFMREALKDTPAESFPEPPENKTKNPILRGNSEAIELKINRKTGKIAVSSTPKDLIITKKYLLPHTILHYINKNKPDGPALSNPSDDPQYEVWEKALKGWFAKEKNLGNTSLQDPPTEYDDPQSAELIPDLKILWPTNSSTITNRQFDFKIKATAPRGVDEVNYYIDNTRISSIKQFPFETNYYAKKLSKGEHTLRVTASDDLGNTAQEEIKFNLQANFDPPSVIWFDSSPLNLTNDDFPRAVVLTPFRWDDIYQVKIYLKSKDSEKLIYTFDQNTKLFGQRLLFTWNNYPGAGDNTLRAVLVDKFGGSMEKKLNINVK